ncbi:hypothetical protein H6G18_08445 [Anabaena subtropica FACHB-260]|uniref:Uncharacterized protein n=1 Tax=Anabaena subtropica FACHB-260 TaxID=2692884 RepID=A0ABR8CLQ6_9NOST|nr:hypothetical protein [Anabaena subtropica FACHB-260]
MITTVDTAEGDRAKYTFELEKKSEIEENNSDFSRSPDHLRLEALPNIDSDGDRGGDREVIADQPAITPPNTQIIEGNVYWSRSLAKQVRVNKIYPSVKKADVSVAGDPFKKPRLAFSDLLMSEPLLAPGDRVEVLIGKHKGEILSISSIHEGQYWLKKEVRGFGKPVGPFIRDQLKRAAL